MANIGIKRAYDPDSRSDGRRMLVERLWPRGIRKEELHADSWEKDVTLLYSARDVEHNSALVLRDYLMTRMKRQGKR